MRITVFSAVFLIATGGIALAQSASEHDGHHPGTGQQQAQQTPQQVPAPGSMGPMSQEPNGEQMKSMMGMMQKMMPMMQEMQKPDASTNARTDMMKQMAPMMQQMMPMMQKMMTMGMQPGSQVAGQTPKHTNEMMQAMNRMNAPMNSGIMANNPDEAFVRGMIPHHQGAIEMAKIVLQYGKDEQVRKWANDVIREQQREMSEMEDWLKKNAK